MTEIKEVTIVIANELLHRENYVRKHPELLISFHTNIQEMIYSYIDLTTHLKFFALIHDKFLYESIEFLHEYSMLNHEHYQEDFCQAYVSKHNPYHHEDDFCYLLCNLLKSNQEEKTLWDKCESIISCILQSFKLCTY